PASSTPLPTGDADPGGSDRRPAARCRRSRSPPAEPAPVIRRRATAPGDAAREIGAFRPDGSWRPGDGCLDALAHQRGDRPAGGPRLRLEAPERSLGELHGDALHAREGNPLLTGWTLAWPPRP